MIESQRSIGWYSVVAGKRSRRYVFLYQHESAAPAYIFTLTAGGVVRHIQIRQGRQALRVRNILTMIRQEQPDLIPLLDDEFFQTLLIAVKDRSINHLLLRRQFMRLRNAHHHSH